MQDIPQPIAPESSPKFSWKFYIGIFLIILNAILGVIAKIFFFINLDNQFKMWLWGGIYLLSWLILILGAWWVGKEYYSKIKKYTDYKFYHESMKKTSTAFVNKARENTKKFTEGALNTSHKFTETARLQSNRVKEGVQKNITSARKNFSKAKKSIKKVKLPFKKKKRK